MIIEILKEIKFEIVINFLCFICGIGIGAGIMDAIIRWEREEK